MNDLINNSNNIENMIYEIRGVQVMLDSDLARIYQCANGTKDINKARFNSYAFTEQGVSMLARVIHTQVTSEVSIKSYQFIYKKIKRKDKI